MISRRALFGLWAGAAAAAVVPVRLTRAVDVLLENHPLEFMRWSGRVNIPVRSGYVIHLTPREPRLYDDSEFSHIERAIVPSS